MTGMSRHSRYLGPAQAASVYDRIGRWQDTQGFYEREAVAAMVGSARLETATSVVEVGCGTGALAASVLGHQLPAEATYLGLDVSGTMVELSRRRLSAFAPRAQVQLVDGHTPWPVPDHTADRVLAAYVLDLFSPEGIDDFFTEAGRILRPAGYIAVTSLSAGTNYPSRLVSGIWTRVWRADPHLIGGCRPVSLEPHLPATWRRLHDATTTSWGISSRTIVLQAPS